TVEAPSGGFEADIGGHVSGQYTIPGLSSRQLSTDSEGRLHVTTSTTDTAPLLIGGELRPAAAGAPFDVLNPATEEVIGAADHAFRARCLRQLRDALQSHIEELRALTIAEVGAPHMFTTGPQLESPVADLGWLADLIESYEWTEDLGESEIMGVRSHRTTRREAIGVVGAITPWNFPNQINLAKIGPALAAG